MAQERLSGRMDSNVRKGSERVGWKQKTTREGNLKFRVYQFLEHIV